MRLLRNMLWNYVFRHWYGVGPCWEGKATPEVMAWADSMFDAEEKE